MIHFNLTIKLLRIHLLISWINCIFFLPSSRSSQYSNFRDDYTHKWVLFDVSFNNHCIQLFPAATLENKISFLFIFKAQYQPNSNNLSDFSAGPISFQNQPAKCQFRKQIWWCSGVASYLGVSRHCCISLLRILDHGACRRRSL